MDYAYIGSPKTIHKRNQCEIVKVVPEIRIQSCCSKRVNPAGDYVLYWMIANRRVSWNFSLDRAVEWAKELNRPLVVLEALRCDYPWASDRFHHFVLEGMVDNARRLQSKPVYYYPYVEPRVGAGKGLLANLAEKACVVVTDDFPCFFLPPMVHSAAARLPVRLEKVDSNGLLPLRAADRIFPTAYAFRRFLQQNLPVYLGALPQSEPLAGNRIPELAELPQGVDERWPAADLESLRSELRELSRLPISHGVAVSDIPGGTRAAEQRLDVFLNRKLPRYHEVRNRPEQDATSGLSPYLHFGHISSHEVFTVLGQKEDWSVGMLADTTSGSRSGWWGMSKAAEGFLDQLVTWRELGYNMCSQRRDYDQYESLPDWALRTLSEHTHDRRDPLYTLEQFASAETHDRLWNAAQTQLVREGRIHSYLRMLWGKKILHWSHSPQEALAIMIELNNRYALDGRNPNSYAGIFWVLGRYDRPWGPERPIFGKVRYMSSESTARKFSVKKYIAKYGDPGV